MEIHFAISLLTVALLVSSSSTFQFKTGQCPEVKPMKDFEMYRFLGSWYVLQGTLTGQPIECITFNVTKIDSKRLGLTQFPQNLSSELILSDNDNPSKMTISLGPSSSRAHFYVLVTDYENFAGFFICENIAEGNFQRAAAILSRTKLLSSEQFSLVKEHFKQNGIHEEDLTGIVSCN